jgi:hypothetical protein
MRIPAEELGEMDLGETWNVLAERRRDAVIQPPNPLRTLSSDDSEGDPRQSVQAEDEKLVLELIVGAKGINMPLLGRDHRQPK